MFGALIISLIYHSIGTLATSGVEEWSPGIKPQFVLLESGRPLQQAEYAAWLMDGSGLLPVVFHATILHEQITCRLHIRKNITVPCKVSKRNETSYWYTIEVDEVQVGQLLITGHRIVALQCTSNKASSDYMYLVIFYDTTVTVAPSHWWHSPSLPWSVECKVKEKQFGTSHLTVKYEWLDADTMQLISTTSHFVVQIPSWYTCVAYLTYAVSSPYIQELRVPFETSVDYSDLKMRIHKPERSWYYFVSAAFVVVPFGGAVALVHRFYGRKKINVGRIKKKHKPVPDRSVTVRLSKEVDAKKDHKAVKTAKEVKMTKK